MYSHETEVLIGKVAKLCYKISAETNVDLEISVRSYYGTYSVLKLDDCNDPDQWIALNEEVTGENLRHTLQYLTDLYTEEKAKMKGESK